MDKDKILKNLEEMKAELSDMMDRVSLMYDAIKYCGVFEDYHLTYTEAISAMHKGQIVKSELWKDSDYYLKAEERGFSITSPHTSDIRRTATIEEMNSLWKVID